MKITYNDIVVKNISWGDIKAYSKTKNRNYLKGYNPYKIAYELYCTKDLSQLGWKALCLLDEELFNKKRATAYKEHFFTKYDYILSKIECRKQNIVKSEKLMKGIYSCLKENSDLPFYEEFMNDYFLVYNTESIIDFAYTLPEKEKEMCKKLLIASIQCYEDTNYSILVNRKDKTNTKDKPNTKEQKIYILANAFLNIRCQDEIWDKDENVIDYLKTNHTKIIKLLAFPYKGELVSKKDKKILSQHYPQSNLEEEEKRFLALAEKAHEDLLSPAKKNEDNFSKPVERFSENNKEIPQVKYKRECSQFPLNKGISTILTHNTENIAVLDRTDLNYAEEVHFSLGEIENEKRQGVLPKETIREKGNIDYSEQQLISQKIGDKGESIVLQNEKIKLRGMGFPEEIISKVRRVSLESDDYGYDILSFDNEGNEHYIEVKTTKSKDKNFSFILTRNELNHAKSFGKSYSIVIVFDILDHPRMWYMGNPFVEEPYKVLLTPVQYRVDVKTE